MNLKLLAIESSGQTCSVALLLGEPGAAKIYCKSASVPRKHAELLLPMINELMQEHSISPEQINFIAFGEGPGNFTGIRLSASIAQGLAYGWNKQVLPVSTLASMALAAGEKYQINKIMVAMDARKQEISFAAYEINQNKSPGSRIKSGKLKISESDDVVLKSIKNTGILQPGKIKLPEGDGWLAIGDAWGKYSQELLPVLEPESNNKIMRLEAEFLPDASMVAKLAERLFKIQGQDQDQDQDQDQNQEGAVLLSAEQALPQYFRDSV